MAAAILVTVAASLTAVAVTATPAHAAVCSWEYGVGSSSECDGMDPVSLESQCGGGTTVRHAYLRRTSDNAQSGILVELRYNATCQTAWGRISYGFGPSLHHNGCTVMVVRSNGSSRHASVPPGQTGAYTPVLYDAGVTAYAYAFCDGSTYDYSGSTTSY